MEALPIEAFKADILGSDAPYIIVEAETGSGKSTMVPQWYRELGYRVLVTEPLVETVVGTSEYVAELAGVQLGCEVGYRTASSRCDSPDSQILFCTDGLALVRELAGHNRFEVLVIDELHEWNTNQSTLEAWAWKHLQVGDSPFRKIIVLSATLDSAELSRKRGNAPVFKVPGRQFPIVDRAAGQDLVADIKTLVAEGFDVLVFQPGKKEIEETISQLSGTPAELIPFHGQLERSEKNRAYRSYGLPKVVVSTNALETGRTLLPSPGRQLAVVDSGLERRVELIDGIEGLYLKPITKARGRQRRGRTGRVGEGVYIDHCPARDRSDYPVPEILRTRLDQTVLRLAVVGYDATELPFFHDLDQRVIVDAKKALMALGAMSQDGAVTQIGRLMAKLPVCVQFARMIVEAEERGVIDEVITIAAILEAGGITDRTDAWRAHTSEQESDLLSQLDLWNAARGVHGEGLREIGIFSKSLYRAREIRAKLVDALKVHRVKFGSIGNRMQILKSCVAGMVDHLFSNEYGDYRNGGNGTRQKARESVVSGSPDWIVGLPKDIQFKDRRGRLGTLNLVSMVTKVDPAWMVEVAPQLVKVEEGISPKFDSEQDSCVSTTKTYFNGRLVKEERVATPEHDKAADAFCDWLASQSYAY
ncbi:MAG: DEAD/DEAH box helicase [Patescibacteria group bacterium]